MSSTGKKIDFISDAYSHIRVSGLTVQPTPPELELALTRLENMAAEWFSRNMCANYNFEDEPCPSTESCVDRSFWHAFSTNLAVRLLSDFGKAAPQELFLQAQSSSSNLAGRSAIKYLQRTPYPDRMPMGHGNTLRYNRWSRFYRNQAAASNSCATNHMIAGDVDDFTEHFATYLKGTEAISTYSIVTDPALILVSDSLNGEDVLYRIEATDATNSTALDNQLVTIIVTTDSGRIETRYIYFNITPKAE